jgi:hypothetical protein
MRVALVSVAIALAACSTSIEVDDSAASATSGATSSSSVGTGGAGGASTSSSVGTGGAGVGWSDVISTSASGNTPFGLGIDAADNVVLGVRAYGPVDVGDGPIPERSVLVRYDPGGNILWAKGLAADPSSLAVHPSGDIFFGGAFGDGPIDLGAGPMSCAVSAKCIVVARLDAGGQVLWSRTAKAISGGGVEPLGLAVDAAGDVVVGGRFQGILDFGGVLLQQVDNLGDAFVVKLSSNGDALWGKAVLGANAVSSVAIDGAGDVVLVGSHDTAFDLGGDPVPGSGLFLAKLGPSGAHILSRSFGASGEIFATVDGAGNVLLTGSYNAPIDFGGGLLENEGPPDLFVVKLDAMGNHVFSRGFGAAAIQNGLGIAADAAGNAFVTGFFAGAVDFGAGAISSAGQYDAFLVKYDPKGSALESHAYGDAETQVAWYVVVDSVGVPIVTGAFHGTIDLGQGPFTSSTESTFIARIAP